MIRQSVQIHALAIQTRQRLAARVDGASAVEYAIMIALIALVIIVAVALLGTNLRDKFSTAATLLN